METFEAPPSPDMAEGSVSKSVALLACTSMAVFYVAILHSPVLILRLPPPTSLNQFMIRRFVCAAISSFASAALCAFLLPVKNFPVWQSISFAYGLRLDHLGAAVLFPLSLTSLLYTGTFVSKCLFIVRARNENELSTITFERLLRKLYSATSDVMAWRNYIVAPLTEEMVFRACMTPLLLCGGFKTYVVIFLSPIFFSLAHLNHFLELYCQQKYSFVKASMIAGFQLGYTVIFGWYACFLFNRTGHLLAPIVAHALCNTMGLPILSSSHGRGLTLMASAIGIVAFFCLLFPATNPELYNYRTDNCTCWHRYCSW